MPLKLPVAAVTLTDVQHMLRDLEALERHYQHKSKGGPRAVVPVSRHLQAFAATNRLDMQQADQRQSALDYLMQLKKKAPVVHLTFASDPPREVVGKLAVWFRTRVHPDILLQTAVQPSIAGGCTVRTPSQFFDLSLRQHFRQHMPQLVEQLDKGLSQGSASA